MLLALAAVLAQALPPKQDDVDAAIKRGADWLLAKESEGLGVVGINIEYGLSYDALVLYTLHHAGVDKNHRQVVALADKVASVKINRTYTAACTAMALREHDPTKYKAKIYECGQFLVDTLCENGQWGYGVDVDIPKFKPADSGSTRSRIRITRSRTTKTAKPEPCGDNSNTQYAALGIYACWMSGFDFEREVIDRAVQWWEGSQNADGSWDYGEKGGKVKCKEGGFGSMTAGGGSSIVLLNRVKGHTTKNAAAGRAVSWLGANFSVSENPGGPTDRKRFHYYYLYALERLGDLYPADKMGKYGWYAEGANYLLKMQRGGMWQGPQPGMEVADTCFAILFLHRAMKVATGEKK